jgi:hypothetical protein
MQRPEQRRGLADIGLTWDSEKTLHPAAGPKTGKAMANKKRSVTASAAF